MAEVALFDPGPFWRHPGLWPPADESVLSDDEAAELLWPGPGMTPASSASALSAGWDGPHGGEGSGSW